MRGLVWIALGVAGCGSVSPTRPMDAGDDAGDARFLDEHPPPPAAGTPRWARSLSSLQALGVADGPGGLVVTGALTAPADLGGAPLVPIGGAALVVAGFDTSAKHLFSVRHGDVGAVFPFVHLLNGSGAPFVNGVSYGDVDLGKGKVAGGSPGVTSGIPADGYIGLYGPGAPAWVARLVGPGEDKIVATAPGFGSAVYGAGWFEATPTFNGATLTGAGGRDLFLARFDAFTGNVQLTRTYGGPGRDEISSAARNGDALAIAGMFDDTLDFGGTTRPITTLGLLDIWVAKLDENGDGIWAVRYGGVGDDRDPHIAVDALGDVYLAGSFTGQIAFGAVNLVAHGASDVDIFVVKLRATDGSVAWAVSLGSAPTTAPVATTGVDGVADLVVDADHVAIAATLNGSVDGKPPVGGVDALIATFDVRSGATRASTVYATTGDDRAFAIAYGRDHDLYAVVNLGGAYDFGVPLIGAPGPASVLLRLIP